MIANHDQDVPQHATDELLHVISDDFADHIEERLRFDCHLRRTHRLPDYQLAIEQETGQKIFRPGERFTSDSVDCFIGFWYGERGFLRVEINWHEPSTDYYDRLAGLVVLVELAKPNSLEQAIEKTLELLSKRTNVLCPARDNQSPGLTENK